MEAVKEDQIEYEDTMQKSGMKRKCPPVKDLDEAIHRVKIKIQESPSVSKYGAIKTVDAQYVIHKRVALKVPNQNNSYCSKSLCVQKRREHTWLMENFSLSILHTAPLWYFVKALTLFTRKGWTFFNSVGDKMLTSWNCCIS